jgi:hypothetical protein
MDSAEPMLIGAVYTAVSLNLNVQKNCAMTV